MKAEFKQSKYKLYRNGQLVNSADGGVVQQEQQKSVEQKQPPLQPGKVKANPRGP